MSTNLFFGARKALVASITMAALMGGFTVATTPYAAASATVATASASAKVNAFTNADWLNGVWRTGAGFSIPATAANQAAFKAGVSVRLADGQVRKISRAQIVGSNMSIFLEGAKLDGNKVGAPQVVTIGSTTTAPVTSTPSTTAPVAIAAHSTSINAFSNTDWLNGVWRKSPGFSIPANDANKAAFKVGASVKLADGQVRKVTQVQVVGANMSVYLDGAAVNGSVVGAPNKLSTAGTTTATPAPTTPTTSVIATSNLNNFTNTDWLNGVFRASAGFSIQASSANVAAFKAGALVRLADGQTRKVLRQQVVGSNMSVFLEGAAINGTSLGYPKTVSVVSTSAGTPSSPALTTPPAAVAPAPTPSAPDTTNGKPLLVGVNLSGAGFGPSVVPGTHGTNYTYPAESYYKKYADLGMPLVRLPFLWERIQPKLGTPLNTVELARLKQSLDFAQKHNVKVILDLHNYYRYFGKLIGSNDVPISSFAAVWKQIAQEVVNHPAVEGYGLMNEPHSTNGLWPQAALAAAQAIRTVDSKRWIYVAGDRWSSAFHWPHYNTQLITNPWMRDPKNNLVYEAHMYVDKDFSGNYFDKNEKFDPMIGVNRVKPFVDWLKQNKLRGYIGEHGVPDFSPSAIVATDNLMTYLRQNCIPSTYWAAGPWWGEYALSLDVVSGKHRPQLPVLQKHAKTAHNCTSIGPL
ncbi:cellulase [Stutzerimonas stutzeri]|uniref:Cellulase n=1 Tax=Stutzerimonas stutzeri TaxID=316 RepID=A0A2S4ALM7_STUST|nr:glycoside hydrolase family 5 protein [Stutzerimonas stutzeri]MCQ4261963.1 glycoside hydrolase family 5 protein [Stutzerimonas stutzeri]POH82405.1 cellulase [Stutzerimonas stutzeri]